MQPGLGAVSRARRTALGLTQAALAAQVESPMSQSKLLYFEHGHVQLPQARRLTSLATALGLSPAELLARAGCPGAVAALLGDDLPLTPARQALITLVARDLREAAVRALVRFACMFTEERQGADVAWAAGSAMPAPPIADQITAAMQRAAWAARERTRSPDRIAKFPRGVGARRAFPSCR
ncbi:MAG: helix-turn-helix domain-containing protein [Thermomicrobiales bacterium]